jgi:threonine/homoserine/homoserine lactone efflux protein
VLRQVPAVDGGLRLVCGFYLGLVAWRLWRDAGHLWHAARPVPFPQVLLTTFLNPKAAVFAFVLLPHLREGRMMPALPYLAVLMVCIGGVAAGWIALGAGLHSGRIAIRPLTARRGGAVVLACLACAVSASTLAR